jgi:dimethylamine monooxygenase subunit C
MSIEQSAVFVAGKQKYIFCADQKGMAMLSAVIEQVQRMNFPYALYLLTDVHNYSNLSNWLSDQKMGTYLYASFPFEMLGKMKKLAEDVGYTEEEVQFIGYGRKTNRIFCCRCHYINQTKGDVLDIPCVSCNLTLLVSDHYSVYHDAFLGYVAKL